MLELVAAFLCGVLFTVFLGAAAWVYSQPLLPPKARGFSAYSKPKLPKSLEEVYGYVNGSNDSTEVKVESCNWFNVIVDFIFRELRDSPEVKRFVMKKIRREFAELMLNKTEGKMIEQLTVSNYYMEDVRDYSFGTSLPVLSSVTILKIECSDEDGREPMEIDLSVGVDYSGGFRLAIDADLVFNKSAYVSIQVLKVKGHGRLRFTLKNFTHWSFAFSGDPELELKVDSQLGGRRFPQLSSFIENQFRKWVRRKYTLPASKVRFKPFFRQYKPQDQLLDVYVHDHHVTVGELKVEVVECARLLEVEGATKTYCTLCVAATPCQAQVGLWMTTWPVHKFSVRKEPHNIGIMHKAVQDHDLVLIYRVPAGSSALSAGIKEGDVLTRVNRAKVTSVKQANRLLQRSKDSSILITIQRPPSHFTSELLRRVAMDATDSGHATAGRDGNQRGTAETDGGEPAAKEGKREQPPPPLKKAAKSASSIPSPALFQNKVLDGFAPQDDYSHSFQCPLIPTSRPHPQPPPLRQLDEDSISLPGERELEGMGRRYPRIKRKLPQRHTLSLDESRTTGNTPTEEADTSSLNGVITAERTPTGLSQPAGGVDDTDSVDLGRVEGGRGDDRCDESARQLRTSEIAACKHPVWDEQFEFNLKKEHHYLNVCVWAGLAEGRRSLLIGHVTISLMDVALECVSTSSGTHHQRYVLVADQPAKATASRVALHANSSSARHGPGADDPPFVGDIFLRFWHTPAVHNKAEEDQEDLEKEISEQSDSADVGDETSMKKFNQHHPFTAEPGHLPSDHYFVIVKNQGIKCDICYKKIWGKKLQKCKYCKLKCHRKCVLYCQREVPCYRRGSESVDEFPVDHLSVRVDGDYTVYSDDDSDMENGNRHRHLEQTPEPGELEEADDSDDSFKNSDLRRALATDGDDEEDGPPLDDTLEDHHQNEVPRLYSILREGISPEREVEKVEGLSDVDTAAAGSLALPEDAKDESGSEDRVTGCTPDPTHPFLAPLLEGDSSGSEPDLEQRRLLEELCHALYRDLPPSERRTNLKQKIRSVQADIDDIRDLINSTARELSCPGLSPLQEVRIRERMERDNEKLQPLELLMKQYVRALEYCPESEPN